MNEFEEAVAKLNKQIGSQKWDVNVDVDDNGYVRVVISYHGNKGVKVTRSWIEKIDSQGNIRKCQRNAVVAIASML